MGLDQIRRRIHAAETAAGRAPGDVTLIAVSEKVQPLNGSRRGSCGRSTRLWRELRSGGGRQVAGLAARLSGVDLP